MENGNTLEGWREVAQQAASTPGQRLLFENGSGMSRKVRNSLKQGQTLLWEGPNEATKPVVYYLDDGSGVAALYNKHTGKAQPIDSLKSAEALMKVFNRSGKLVITTTRPKAFEFGPVPISTTRSAP